MQVSQLVNAVVSEMNARPWAEHFNSLNTEAMLRLIDFLGPTNVSLANPLNQDPNVFYFRSRQDPLTGDEEIRGDYLLFDYSSHYECIRLREFASRMELEQFILGGAGITNNYTADLVPIIHSKIKHYMVTYFDAKTGSRKAFDKLGQFIGPEYFCDYPDLQLHWLD